MQAARQVLARGDFCAPLSAGQLRLAAWKASQSGVDDTLLHPLLNIPCPAGEAVQVLLSHIRPALAESGDEEQVTAELARILSSGTGARRQREIMMSTQSLPAVVHGAPSDIPTGPHRPGLTGPGACKRRDRYTRRTFLAGIFEVSSWPSRLNGTTATVCRLGSYRP